MTPEYEALLDTFRVHDDLEHVIEATIQHRLEQGYTQPINASLPPQWGRIDAGPAIVGADDDEPRVKRVECRVVKRAA